MKLNIEINNIRIPVPVVLVGIVVIASMFIVASCNIDVASPPIHNETRNGPVEGQGLHNLFANNHADNTLTVRDYIAIQVYSSMVVAYYENGGRWNEKFMRNSLPKAYEAADYFLGHGN